MSRNAFDQFERDEMTLADQREMAAQERAKAQAAWEAYRQDSKEQERNKRAMEWAISTGAKP